MYFCLIILVFCCNNRSGCILYGKYYWRHAPYIDVLTAVPNFVNRWQSATNPSLMLSLHDLIRSHFLFILHYFLSHMNTSSVYNSSCFSTSKPWSRFIREYQSVNSAIKGKLDYLSVDDLLILSLEKSCCFPFSLITKLSFYSSVLYMPIFLQW